MGSARQNVFVQANSQQQQQTTKVCSAMRKVSIPSAQELFEQMKKLSAISHSTSGGCFPTHAWVGNL